MQRTISAMVAEREEDESLPPVELTAEAVSGLAAEAEVPEKVREQIEKSYAHTFGEQPPAAHNVLDSRLVGEGLSARIPPRSSRRLRCSSRSCAARRERNRRGRRAVGDGRQHQHRAHVPEERAASIRTGIVEGRKCLLVPIEE